MVNDVDEFILDKATEFIHIISSLGYDVGNMSTQPGYYGENIFVCIFEGKEHNIKIELQKDFAYVTISSNKYSLIDDYGNFRGNYFCKHCMTYKDYDINEIEVSGFLREGIKEIEKMVMTTLVMDSDKIDVK